MKGGAFASNPRAARNWGRTPKPTSLLEEYTCLRNQTLNRLLFASPPKKLQIRVAFDLARDSRPQN